MSDAHTPAIRVHSAFSGELWPKPHDEYFIDLVAQGGYSPSYPPLSKIAVARGFASDLCRLANG